MERLSSAPTKPEVKEQSISPDVQTTTVLSREMLPKDLIESKNELDEYPELKLIKQAEIIDDIAA